MSSTEENDMTNLIVEKFDFIASQCGWNVHTQLAVWKTIALLLIQRGSSTEESILTFLTHAMEGSELHEKEHGPGSCNDLKVE